MAADDRAIDAEPAAAPNPSDITKSGGPRRIVLLGASNLTRGVATVLSAAESHFGAPLEIFAAIGHGRSYGMTSRLFGRSLPGIRECGLWNALDAAPSAPTAALVTDIGNDLLYGASPATILGWIDESLHRLAARRSRTVMTLLPMESIERLTPWRFYLIRTCTFPNCRLDFKEIIFRACTLNEGLESLAAAHGIPTVNLPGAWFGYDAIHIRRRAWRGAWSSILASWSDVAPPQPARRSLAHYVYLRSLFPERRRLFGFEQRTAQPRGKLRDGTTIALF